MAKAVGYGAAVALAIAVFTTSCGGGAGSTAAGLSLSACRVQGVPARCGQFALPENPSASSGRKISLRVVVIPAESSDRAPDPLFYFAGGPGGAASDSTAWVYRHFNLLNQHHDLVLIDQRGTGGSNPVSCSLVPRGPTDSVPAVINDCIASVKGQADPQFYTTPVSVDDFDRVRAALGYDQINLYGVSYGVSSGLDYIQRHGGHVRSAVFDSGSLLDVHLWERVPVSAQSSLDEVFSRCASDQICAKTFPNLKADFRAVTAKLAVSPATIHVLDPTSQSTMTVTVDLVSFLNLVVDGYLSTAQAAASLPQAIHSAARGDWSSFAVAYGQSGAADSTPTLIMFATIICSDAWAALDPATIASIGTGSFFTPQTVAKASLNNAACRYWPHGVGASGPVNSSAPIVFLNGTADPADPPANVANAAVTMPNSLSVTIPGFGHGVIDQDSTSCLADRATTFFEVGRPSTLSNWSCPNLLPSFVTE